MCNCKNVQIGSYDNQVQLIPHWNSAHKTVCIDRCLEDEIKHLWTLGIITNGCCCGHNKLEGFIGVENEFIELMKELGYKVKIWEKYPNREDNFIPKTKL